MYVYIFHSNHGINAPPVVREYTYDYNCITINIDLSSVNCRKFSTISFLIFNGACRLFM